MDELNWFNSLNDDWKAIFWGNKTTIPTIHDINKIFNLVELEVYVPDYGPIEIEDLTPLKKLKKLKKLIINYTSVNSLEPLSELYELEELYCDQTNNTDLIDLTPLQNLKMLKKVSFFKAGVKNIHALNSCNNLVEACFCDGGTNFFEVLNFSKKNKHCKVCEQYINRNIYSFDNIHINFFKEVKELINVEKINEALLIANKGISLKPDNIWNKKALALVYNEFLKLYADSLNIEGFIEFLTKFKELQLSEEEKISYETCTWRIGKFIWKITHENNIEYSILDKVFDICKDFHFIKPSKAYSFLFKAFQKAYSNWHNYLAFADWWGLNNFLPEDFKSEENNGKKIMSIVEQAYIAYSKKLLEGEFLDIDKRQRIVNKDKIQSFLNKLDIIIDEHPEYQYLPYFKAKLLLAIGNTENALSEFLPFAKKKKNNFWIWQALAEFFSDDKEKQFACYCKALSLNTPDEYLVKIRAQFAELLIKKNLFNEAKTEIENIILTRQKKGWSIPTQIKEWTKQTWFISSTAYSNNNELYLKHLTIAEKLLYINIPETFIVVNFINKEKKIVYFINTKKEIGFFNYSNLIENPSIGDVLKARLVKINNEGLFKAYEIKQANHGEANELIIEVEGQLTINNKGFGFVNNNTFVPKELIIKYNLSNNLKIKGQAMLSFDKKKNQFGWKMFKLYNYEQK